jgi:DNA-directed RNA polymerase subunit RPC12/RpoP
MAEPHKRGRPSLVEQAQREATPPPTPLPGKVPLFQCSRCGGTFKPKVARTLPDGVSMMRCDKCSYAHKIPKELLARLATLPKP